MLQTLTPIQVTAAIAALNDYETLNYTLAGDTQSNYRITKTPAGFIFTIGNTSVVVGAGTPPPTPPILVVPILYVDLVALKAANNLVAGIQYLIIDFRVKENIPNTADVHLGVVEPLIIEALSNQRLSTIVQSPTYPQDILNYELVDTTAQGGDMGRIYYRKDNVINISTYYDWRNIVFRRWETAAGSGIFTVVTDNGFAFQDFYTFNNSTIAATCYAFNINKVYDDTLNNSIYGADSFGNFIDNNSQDNTNLNGGFRNNTISENFKNNVIDGNFRFNVIDRNFDGNIITDFFSNKIAHQFTNNIIFVFDNNTTQGNFNNNGSLLIPLVAQNNIVGVNFSNNIIDINFFNNKIGNDFNNNTIGNNFSNNVILENFNTNTIGVNFYQNNVYSNFSNNIVADNFINNTVENNFSGFNLAAATWVYMANFSKHILQNQGGNFAITFLSAGNVPQYDLPTN